MLTSYKVTTALHILEVRKFPDYEKFRTDLQWVFGFLQRDQNDEELEKYVTEHRDAFSDLPVDAYDMLSKREARGIELGIQGMIKIYQEFGISMEVALQKIMKEFSLSEDKAQEYIQKYWVQN